MPLEHGDRTSGRLDLRVGNRALFACRAGNRCGMIRLRLGDVGPRRRYVVLGLIEILPLGSFATWQAERAVGDHDRSTLRLRLDPQGAQTGFEPGMTVWLKR